MLSGIQTIDGKTYQLTDRGATISDWGYDGNGNTFYFGSDGAAVTGWNTLPVNKDQYDSENDTWSRVTTEGVFYFDSDCHMVTGIQTIDGKIYRLTSDGVTKNDWGYDDTDSRYYFGEDGAAVSGWQTIAVKRNLYDRDLQEWVSKTVDGIFCFDSACHMMTGLQTIDGKTYMLSEDGAKTNEWSDDYYFGAEGYALTGWQDVERYGETKHLYFTADGKLAEGVTDIDGKKYYFRQGEQMISSGNFWVSQDDRTLYYFMQEDGSLLTGWKIEEGSDGTETKYYYNEDGERVSGWLEADGNLYYLNPMAYVSQTCELEKDGYKQFFTFDETGKVIAQSEKRPTEIIAEGGRYQLNSKGKALVFKGPVKAGAKTLVILDTVDIAGKSFQVTEIADKACEGMSKLTTVTIGAHVKNVGKKAFSGCKALKTVKGGNSVTTLGASAFASCGKLTTLPAFEKLQSIGESAFSKCTALKSVKIGKNVKNIGKNAFNGCKNLKTITIATTKLTAKNVGAGAFKGTPGKTKVQCPAKKLKEYKKLLVQKGVSKKAVFK